jgi:hypothetical protein
MANIHHLQLISSLVSRVYVSLPHGYAIALQIKNLALASMLVSGIVKHASDGKGKLQTNNTIGSEVLSRAKREQGYSNVERKEE